MTIRLFWAGGGSSEESPLPWGFTVDALPGDKETFRAKHIDIEKSVTCIETEHDFARAKPNGWIRIDCKRMNFDNNILTLY